MGWLDDLTPHARVVTAVVPFVIAILVRVFVGKTKMTSLLFSASTIWFAINVLMVPYSSRMQQEILQIRTLFH
jgi:hypothetical protein